MASAYEGTTFITTSHSKEKASSPDLVEQQQQQQPQRQPQQENQTASPHGNAWSLFGPHDELGMLNLLTPARTRAAAREVVDGVRISTDLPLDKFTVPSFGRAAFEQKVLKREGRTVNDDVVCFNTQGSSQWDGFRHFEYQDRKVFFNGKRQEDFHTTKQNGVHAWAENGGIVGRGVLLDYHSWAESQGLSPSALESTPIPLASLQAVAAAQDTTFLTGDILLIRSGYIKAFNALSPAEAALLTATSAPTAIGVESSEANLRWIWEKGFAAVAGDMPSFEAWPCQDTKYFLHEWLLAGWGMPIGELFHLERLAVECAQRRKWTFFFSSMPLKVPGGVASPPNGVAIL